MPTKIARPSLIEHRAKYSIPTRITDPSSLLNFSRPTTTTTLREGFNSTFSILLSRSARARFYFAAISCSRRRAEKERHRARHAVACGWKEYEKSCAGQREEKTLTLSLSLPLSHVEEMRCCFAAEAEAIARRQETAAVTSRTITLN